MMKNHIEKVQKRDGSIVAFDQKRITNAIFKALTATGEGNEKRAKRLSDKVVQILNRRFKKGEIPHVEQIQDIVEEVLILEGLVKTAKAYILYREQRRRIREAIAVSEEAVDRLDQYIEKLDWEVQENANMTFSLQGLNHYGVSYIIKKYWLNKIYPPEIRRAHEEGDFHLHNLDTLSTYCQGWDLYDLLIKGFGGVPGKVESKPPKHFNTALMQCVNFLYTLQGECYSEDTQVLTENGWKYFFEVLPNDKIFTLNIKTNKIELQKPIRFYQYENQKELFHFRSKKIDLLVTPGHRMVVKDLKDKKIKFVEAKNFNPKQHLLVLSLKKFEKIPTNPGIKKVKYKGKVYCLEVKNHTLYVRRNGKATWCGNCAGAVSFSNFDTLLSPFIRYDNLNYQQVKQALQEFLFNMAIPTRTGFQCPFTNITLDLKPSPVFKNLPVVIGGKPQDKTYAEFEEEMKIFNKALYEVYMEGDAKGRPFHFPIPTINITKDFPWQEPAFDGIFEASAKYGTNYFANYINSDLKPEDVRSMCCRLRLDLTQLHNRGGGGLFGSGAKTGSIGVVTINLPRIGYLSKTKKEFFERLAKVMDLAKESLEIKRKVLENFIEKGLYPYSRYYLQDIKRMRGKYWANHFSTIGLVGMNECLLNFMGENIATKRGRKFALEVLDFMRERLVKYQKETGNIYNLEQTPAESTSYRLALKDKERYPDIITAGTKKIPYYTNSTQLPVNFTDDLFLALKLQEPLTCKYTGGSVFHIFLGERLQSGEQVKILVKKIFENFKIPYITITPTFSICPVHGYISGEHFFCPKCTVKQPCEVYSRIVGYYRPVSQWNEGKQKEFAQRKEFKIPEKIFSAKKALKFEKR